MKRLATEVVLGYLKYCIENNAGSGNRVLYYVL